MDLVGLNRLAQESMYKNQTLEVHAIFRESDAAIGVAAAKYTRCGGKAFFF